MSFLPSKPSSYTLIDIFLENPDLTRPLMDFSENLMRGPSPFSESQRETIFAYISGLNGCQFCQMSHTVTVEKLGGKGSWIQDLLSNRYPDDLSAEMKPVLDYARKMNSELEQITQQDIDAVLEAGWDEQAVLYIACVCGIANFYNRIVSGLGIPPDKTNMERGGNMLATHGYKAINAMLDS